MRKTAVILVEYAIMIAVQFGLPIVVAASLQDAADDFKMEEPVIHHKFWRAIDLHNKRTSCTSNKCYCDEMCPLYDDCCQAGQAGDRVWPPSGHVPPRTTVACRTIEALAPQPVMMVDKCLDSYSDTGIRKQCEGHDEEGLLRVPVTDPDTRIMYRNVYCAICHGIQHATFWLQQSMCESSPREIVSLFLRGQLGNYDTNGSNEQALRNTEMGKNVSQFFEENQCSTHSKFTHPDFSYRPCTPHTAACHGLWREPEYIKACASYTSFTQVGSVTYKNVHCAICNFIDVKRLLKIDPFSDMIWGKPETHHDGMPGTDFPFSIIIDLNQGKYIIRNHWAPTTDKDVYMPYSEEQDTCTENEIFDPYCGKCRALRCKRPLVLKKGNCVHVNHVNSSTARALHCPLISFNGSEYDLFENGSVRLHASQKILRLDEYYRNGSIVGICAPWSSDSGMFHFDPVQGIVSLIGQIVSLISLAFLFAVYMLFPSLRNLPGKCMMSLVVSLFVAHLLFLVGIGQTEREALCLASSLLMHFSFLASFFWTNVLAFQLWRTFSSATGSQAKYPENTHFLMYSIYGWLTPFLIVLVCALLDTVSTHQPFAPHYGHGICWLTNAHALVTFFGAPLVVSLLINILLYILTLKNITKTSRDAKMVGHVGRRWLLMIYAKLSTIMGFTWIFGFAAAFAKVSAFWYIFIIFNTLQGLFLCLAFGCNSKVVAYFKSFGKQKMARNNTKTSTFTTRVG